MKRRRIEIVAVMQNIQGVEDLGVFRVLGQPNLNFTVDREQASRYGINVSDVQDAIQTAVGGNALTQVLIGEQRYDLVLRYLPDYRDTREAIENIRLLAPTGERVSLAQLTKVNVTDGGSEIYREANSRYVAVKFSVRGRDLGSTVEEAMKKVNAAVKLPHRLYHRLGGRVRKRKALAAAPAVCAAANDPGHLRHSVHHVQIGEMGAADPDQHRHGPDRRAAGAVGYAARTSAFRPASDFLRCLAFRCRSASSWWSTLTSFGLEAMTLKMPRWKARCCGFGRLR